MTATSAASSRRSAPASETIPPASKSRTRSAAAAATSGSPGPPRRDHKRAQLGQCGIAEPDMARWTGRGEGQLGVEGWLDQGRRLRAQPPGPVELETGDRVRVGGEERVRRGPLRPGRPAVPAAGIARHHGRDLAGIADQHHLAAERAQAAEVGVGQLPGLIDQADVRGVALVTHPQPAGSGGHDHAPPAAEIGRTLQISGPGIEAERPSRVAGAEQGHLGADSDSPIGDVERLSARLGRDGHLETGTPMQLLGQVYDQACLAGAGRRGDHHRRVARPRREQGRPQSGLGLVRRGRWRRPYRNRCRGGARPHAARVRTASPQRTAPDRRYDSAAAMTTSSGTSRRRGVGGAPPDSHERRAA